LPIEAILLGAVEVLGARGELRLGARPVGGKLVSPLVKRRIGCTARQGCKQTERKGEVDLPFHWIVFSKKEIGFNPIPMGLGPEPR
jgi:hypothetical protein